MRCTYGLTCAQLVEEVAQPDAVTEVAYAPLQHHFGKAEVLSEDMLCRLRIQRCYSL